MMSDTPVMIEVALNGQTRRDRNPHVPLSRQEIIEEGLRCIEAGASIVHNHNEDLAVPAEAADRSSASLTRPIMYKMMEPPTTSRSNHAHGERSSRRR